MGLVVVDHSSKAVTINIALGHLGKRDSLHSHNSHNSSSISILPAPGPDQDWSIAEE